jgi:hypothetical protein
MLFVGKTFVMVVNSASHVELYGNMYDASVESCPQACDSIKNEKQVNVSCV